MEELVESAVELSGTVAQLFAKITQLQETLIRMNTRITNLENNWHGDAS